MNAKEQMPSGENNMTSLPDNDTSIPTDEQMPSNKKNREKWNFYNTEEMLLEAPNDRKYFKWYHAPEFQIILANTEVKY